MIIVELLNATLATQKAVCNRFLMAISFSSINFIMFRWSEKINRKSNIQTVIALKIIRWL